MDWNCDFAGWVGFVEKASMASRLMVNVEPGSLQSLQALSGLYNRKSR